MRCITEQMQCVCPTGWDRLHPRLFHSRSSETEIVGFWLNERYGMSKMYFLHGTLLVHDAEMHSAGTHGPRCGKARCENVAFPSKHLKRIKVSRNETLPTSLVMVNFDSLQGKWISKVILISELDAAFI